VEGEDAEDVVERAAELQHLADLREDVLTCPPVSPGDDALSAAQATRPATVTKLPFSF
jgi:hypothetical protein